MPRGGKLCVESANVSVGATSSEVERGVHAGDHVRIKVSDTGQGMTPQVIDHVFEPFFTTKEVGKGSGLGLSQVYGFVKQSDGHILIDSTPGEGTAVTLYLPAHCLGRRACCCGCAPQCRNRPAKRFANASASAARPNPTVRRIPPICAGTSGLLLGLMPSEMKRLKPEQSVFHPIYSSL
jgi:hypothetical protein